MGVQLKNALCVLGRPTKDVSSNPANLGKMFFPTAVCAAKMWETSFADAIEASKDARAKKSV